METIATLERVREKFFELRRLGQRPSAERIIAALNGGSKSTVLSHMKTIAEEEAKAAGSAEIPLEILSELARTTARKLWDEATTMSNAAYDSKIQTLLAFQNHLFDDLKDAAGVEEGLLNDLETANARIEALEKEVAARANADQHLETIKRLLNSKGVPQLTPIMQFLRLLESGRQRNREEVFASMVELGHTMKQARTARDHAVKSEYASETVAARGGVKLAITEAGLHKLPGRSRTA